MVREYLKSVLHEIEEQRKANTAEIEEQRLEKETIDKKIARIQSKKELGEKCVRVLLDMIENGTAGSHITLDTELRSGGSVADNY